MNKVLFGGHKKEYWLEDGTRACMEIFADITSINILNRNSKVEFDGMLKELYDAYREMTG